MSTFVEENTRSREDLGTIVKHLTDENLNHPLEAGWTVSAVLAHLAFWDYRALVLIRKWKKEGIGPSPIDVDVVNETARVLCLAIPPRTAAELVITYAESIDQEIEKLDQNLVSEIETLGQTVRLNRASHRREHLGLIEQALGTGLGKTGKRSK
jgi:hypothetical protein